MKTRNFILLPLLLLLFTSCMPDSFTKFKEDPPKKEAAGGTTTPGDGDGSGGGTGGGEEPPPVDDVQYEIKSVGFFQSEGDTLIFEIADGEDFSVGDTINSSNDLFGGGTINQQIGTVVAVNGLQSSSTSRILAVKLDGADAIDYDDNYSPDPSISIYNNDLTNEPENSVDMGFFIDNCSLGYGLCGNGTFAVSSVVSKVGFLVAPNFPSSDITPNGKRKNLHKRVKVVREPGALSASVARFDYSFNTGEASITGLGVEDSCDNNPLNPLCNGRTDDNTADNDRLVSPYGPFAFPSTVQFDESNPLTVNVALHEDFYGTQLDPEEQASAEIILYSQIPGIPLEEIQEFKLAYYFPNAQRFVIKLDSVAGFNVGHTIRSCRSNAISSCNSDTSNFVEGKAVVDYVDSQNDTLYMSALDFNGRSSEFKWGRFLYNSDTATFRSQVSRSHWLFRTDSPATSISAIWNDPTDLGDDPAGPLIYTIDEAPIANFTINAGTGQIDFLANPDIGIDKRVNVTAQDSTTGEVVGTYELSFDFVSTPTALTFADLSTSKRLSAPINGEAKESFTVTASGNFSNHSTGTIDVGFLEIRQNPADELANALPAGVAINSSAKEISFNPGSFTDASQAYLIEAIHPAWSTTVPITGTVTVNFAASDTFDIITYDQNNGDNLILTLADTSFAGDKTIQVGDTLSSPSGARARVDYIDQGGTRFYVTNLTNNVGIDGFRPGDLLDKATSFIVGRKQIVTTNQAVVMTFDVSDPILTTGLIPQPRKADGTAVTASGGDSFTYSITPNLPSDLVLNPTTGAITAVSPGNVAGLSETSYTIAVTNANGDVVSDNFALSLTESLNHPSMGRYQIVALSSNGERFYRGSKFSTSNGVGGRVLMPLDTDEDGQHDALLVEANGLVADSVGIDNNATFFAAEATAVPYRYWYLKDSTDFDAGDKVTNPGGAQATVIAVDSASDHLFIRLDNGNFTVGEKVEEDDLSTTTTLTNIQQYHFATGILEVSAAHFASVTLGEVITSSGGGTGLVVQKHRGRNNTTDPSDDRYFILVQHTGGPAFAEGETLNGSVVITAIAGPIVDLSIPGGTGFADSSSSGRLDRNGYPFFEGNMIGSFRRTAGEAYQSIGFAVHGTDYGSGKVTVAVEDFDSPFLYSAANTYFIDDFSISMGAVRTESHNRVTGVTMSNLVIGYVGDELYLQPAVKGQFGFATLSPETLPAGLTFDSATGVISGTPTESMNGQDYTVTFKKADNSGVTYTFPFVIYNQFEIAQLTNDASSYVLHREGQGLGGSNCKIFGPQLIDDITDPNYNQAIYGLNDIVCLFEGGESDLFNQGINFDIKAGSGMCEYVQYVPFSYQGFLPGASNRDIIIYDSFPQASSCTNTADSNNHSLIPGVVTLAGLGTGAGQATPTRTFGNTYCHGGSCNDSLSSDICAYDYSRFDSSFPNLDSGTINVSTVGCSYYEAPDDDSNGDPDEISCTCNVTSTSVVECGGDAINGLAGAKLSAALNPQGESSIIIQAFNGLDSGSAMQNIASPLSRGEATNRSLVNFIASRNYASNVANSCIGSTYHMDSYTSVGSLNLNAVNNLNNRTAWENYSSPYDPFGQSSSGGLYNNFYTFNCLDSAQDVKARIRVLVRDWDRKFLPEDHAVTNLNNGMSNSTALAGSPQITIVAGSHTATLSASIDPDVAPIGLGTLIYLEEGTTAGLQTDEDLPIEIARYDGGANLTLKAAAGMNLGPVDFYIRSKQDDNASNSFGDNYDNRIDHDSFWNILGVSNPNMAPNYQYCGDGDILAGASRFNPGSLISITANTNVASLDAPLAGPIPYGSVVEIDDGGSLFYFMVASGSGSTVTFLNTVPFEINNRSWRLLRRIPFPGEEI